MLLGTLAEPIFCNCWVEWSVGVHYPHAIQTALTDFLTARSVDYRKKSTEVANWWVYLLLSQVLSVFASCNLLSVVRCIHIKDVIFLEKWPLYHYVMSLFTPDNFPSSEVYFVYNWYSYSSFLSISVSIVYISPSLCLFF